DALDTLVDARVDQIHRPQDVCLDALEWVVFGGWHDLRGRGMHDKVDAIERSVKTLPVSNVADEEAHAGILAIDLRHLPLRHFAARVDHEPPRVVPLESH